MEEKLPTDEIWVKNPRWRLLLILSRGTAATVIGGSTLIFLGWALAVPPLTRLLPVVVVMNPITALGFVLAGFSLWCLTKEPAKIAYDPCRFSTVLAVLVALMGGLKLADFLFGLGLHIDRLLFTSRLLAAGQYPLSEVAPNTALCFVLAGLAIALADWQIRRGPPPSQFLMLAAAWIALLALVGYTYRILVFYRLGSEMPMSLDSALAFSLLALGFFAARSDRGFMRLILSRTTSGAVVRRLLPMAVLVPWILGGMVLLAEKAEYIGREFGLSVFAVACILIFTMLIWWNARLLHHGDLERAESAERLREASANLQRSNIELQQFAYVASHDLFEPLRMITSYLQLVTHHHSAQLSPQAKEFIGFAIDGANRMHALIRDLLAYSRVDQRGHPFELTDCEEVLDAALKNLQVAIQESNAVVTHERLPCVQVDRMQLLQVFQNLVANAIKFHGPETPNVRIVAERRDSEWLFSVRDNGIGIDPKHFDRLFVIFQRLHTRQEYPGTGIGLAMCKKIIERHGGRIWVESSLGKGSVFFFTLPANPTPSTIVTPPVNPAAVARSASPELLEQPAASTSRLDTAA
jgi:signal transduction histidine kinase